MHASLGIRGGGGDQFTTPPHSPSSPCIHLWNDNCVNIHQFCIDMHKMLLRCSWLCHWCKQSSTCNITLKGPSNITFHNLRRPGIRGTQVKSSGNICCYMFYILSSLFHFGHLMNTCTNLSWEWQRQIQMIRYKNYNFNFNEDFVMFLISKLITCFIIGSTSGVVV